MPLKVVPRHGSPFWYIRGTVRSIAVDESTKTADRGRAEEIRIKREADLLDRSIHGKRKTATFLQAAVTYMDNGGERSYLGKLVNHFGTMSLAKIDQDEIDKAARVLYPKAGPATINRHVIAPMSAVLKHAARRKLCDFPVLERRKEPEGRVRYLSIDEADRLIDACSEHMRPLVIFLLYTGARLSEALYLDWRFIDLSRAHVTFPKTKNGEARGLSIHGRALVALANLGHREGRVFLTNKGKPYAVKQKRGGGQIKTGFNGACRRAGITDFSPHDCRHTWATWHYQQNRDFGVLKYHGGWKTMKMVFRYAHSNTSEMQGAIDALPWGKDGEGTIAAAEKKGKSIA